MLLIDSHAHIYDEAFNQDRDIIIADCKNAGVGKILMPNCAKETIDIMLDCENKYPDVCIPMMGLHPCYVKADYISELETVKAFLQSRHFIAIGEIGLDYHWDISFKAEQIIAFRTQIELALEYSIPIVVHARESMEDCIQVVRDYPGLKGVFHCYSGSLVQAQKLVKYGFHLGIGGIITYKKTNLTEIVKEIPLANLILETDAPYLSPVPYRGKRNSPAYTALIAQTLADVLEKDISIVAAATTQNCIELFKLDSMKK